MSEITIWEQMNGTEGTITPCLHKTAKICLIFAVRLILHSHLSDFCKHPTDGHHIAKN
jgi:hypothetical protein